MWGVNYMKSQKMGSKPKAAPGCIEQSCGLISGSVAGRKFYVNNRKYYKDSNCKYEAVEGVSNFCKQNITSPSNCIDVSWLYPDCKRPVYKKGDTFYANSSCKGIIVDNDLNNVTVSTLTQSSYCVSDYKFAVPIKYDCPQGQDIVYYYNTASRRYQIKVGDSMINIDEYGIGNYCKTAYNLTPAADRTPYPTNRVMTGLSQFRCGDLLNDSKYNTRFVYANMSEYIEKKGDLTKISFYKDSWKAKNDSNKIRYISEYCKKGFDPTSTPIPKPKPGELGGSCLNLRIKESNFYGNCNSNSNFNLKCDPKEGICVNE